MRKAKRLRRVEWLARLVEEIGWGLDATEGEHYYREACALYGIEPRDLNIRHE